MLKTIINTIRRKPNYNIGWIERTFGVRWTRSESPKKEMVKLFFRKASPVLVVLAVFSLIALVDAKANADASEYETRAQAALDKKYEEVAKLEKGLLKCLSGWGLFKGSDGSVVDCAGVKTYEGEAAKKLLAERERYAQSLVLSPMP